jgi:predicted TIM-barrel fold metal-dependent hydrolase
MIIDVHGHLGNINQAPFWAADAKKLEDACSKAGVDRLCVSSARSLMYDAHEGNLELDKALKETEKLLGYVVLNPVFPETMKDIELLHSNPKFKGIKLHPDYHGYDVASRKVMAFMDEAAKHVKLMLFHVSCMPGTGFADAVRIARFAERHPDVNIIMAHVAGLYQNGSYPYFPNLKGLEDVSAMRFKNVFIDTAHYLVYVYPGVMDKIVELAGAGQVVFGTDVPLQSDLQMRFAIDAVNAADISQEEKENILFLNAKKLFGL